jgi:hypothetical protein
MILKNTYFRRKNGVLTQNKLWRKIDHNIGFWEKRHFFRWKLAKIAENW